MSSFHKLVCPRCGETENASSAVADTCNGVPMLKLSMEQMELARAVVDKATGMTDREIDIALLKLRETHKRAIIHSNLDTISAAAKALAGAGGGHGQPS